MSTKKVLTFNKDRVLNGVAAGLFLTGLSCVGYVFLSKVVQQREAMKSGNLACVKNSLQKNMSDEHMAGLISSNRTVRIFENYYNCNEAKRGDLAYFSFSNQIEPVVRIIRALPGDKYTLSEVEDKKGHWRIMVNGELLTANGEPYFIKSNTVPPLKTYEISKGGVLGADEFILLSNVPPGLSDSSNLGLVHKKNLIGKVVVE